MLVTEAGMLTLVTLFINEKSLTPMLVMPSPMTMVVHSPL